MPKLLGTLSLVLALAACTTAEPPPVSTISTTALGTVTPVQPATENCREFQTPVTVGGKEEQAFGRACQQADGSWKIVGENPNQPNVIVGSTVYNYPYPYYYPWGPPFFGFVGLGFGFGFHHGHHFHHFHHHR